MLVVAERQILLFGLLTATLPENRQICQRRPAKTGVHFTVDRAGFFWLFGQSAIVHNGQFTVNFSPVLNRHRPLFRGFKCGQVKCFQKSGIARENAPLTIQLPVSGVQALNRVRSVDHFAYIRRELKDRANDIPVVIPALHGAGIFLLPFLCDFVQCFPAFLLGWSIRRI